MAVDLTGGIDPSSEYVLAKRPQDPEMRDSVSFWVVDDRGEIGLPRVGIEAVGANWDAHDIQVNVAFPDGRVYRLRTNGPSLPAQGPDGQATVLGAGGLVLSVHRIIRQLDDVLRRAGSADLVGRLDRRQKRRPADRHQCPRRGGNGGASLGCRERCNLTPARS